MADGDESRDPTRVYGVDFSAAAADAGDRTWVTTATVVGGELRVDGVEPLVEFADLPSAGRDETLQALTTWIRGLDERAVVGLDFPFGLPRFLLTETGHDSWRSFMSGFPESFVSPADGDADAGATVADPVRAFAERCVELTGEHGEGTYDKRTTDGAVGARSPYGFIADTITFHGIRDVLGPVADAVRIEPMDSLASDGSNPIDDASSPPGPTLVETYPAAVFDALGLHRTNYKGSSDVETTRRRRNAAGLAERDAAHTRSVDRVDRLVGDDAGDALDSVAACLGAYAASERGYEVVGDGADDPETVALEGYIYALRDR